MAEQSRTVRFISKLVQQTKNKEITWAAETCDDADSGTAYVTEIGPRRMRIFRYTKEIPNPAYAAYAMPWSPTSATTLTTSYLMPRGEPPKTVMLSGTVLEAFDGQGRSLYRFGDIAGLGDLHEAASYAAAKIDDLMDLVLGKE